MTVQDLEDYYAAEETPLSVRLHNGNYTLLAPQPPASGVVLGFMLKVLDGKHAHTHIHAHTQTHTCTHTYTRTHKHTHRVHTHTCRHTHTQYTHVYTHTPTHIDTHMHTQTHTHTKCSSTRVLRLLLSWYSSVPRTPKCIFVWSAGPPSPPMVQLV